MREKEIIQSMSLLIANVCHEYNFVKSVGGPMLVESLYPIKVNSFPKYAGACEDNENLSTSLPEWNGLLFQLSFMMIILRTDRLLRQNIVSLVMQVSKMSKKLEED